MSEIAGSAIATALLSSLLSAHCWGQSSILNDNDYRIILPGAEPAFSWQKDSNDSVGGRLPEVRSEMLFKLTAKSIEDNALDAEVEAGKATWTGDVTHERIDFLRHSELRMQDVNNGFSYLAGVEIESPGNFSSQSEFISSRQLGLHYGRLGSVNYSGVDLSFKQIVDDSLEHSLQDDKDLWSLGMTTGRRFALTGLDSNDPLWTVSLRGQLTDMKSEAISAENQLWYLSPGLHWQSDSFRLSADLLMPFMQNGEGDEEADYRIRAKIQKRF